MITALFTVNPDKLPVTSMVSSPSVTLSWSGVMVNVPDAVALRLPAGMVMVLSVRPA